MGEYLLKREEETQGVKSLSHQELVGRLLLSHSEALERPSELLFRAP